VNRSSIVPGASFGFPSSPGCCASEESLACILPCPVPFTCIEARNQIVRTAAQSTDGRLLTNIINPLSPAKGLGQTPEGSQRRERRVMIPS